MQAALRRIGYNATPLCLYSLTGAFLLFADPTLVGGADMIPHLALIAEYAAKPDGIHSVYPPAFHALGALLAPAISPALYMKLSAIAGAIGAMLAFMRFRRVAEMPDVANWVYVAIPYNYMAVLALPKIEFLGLGLMYLGLSYALENRPAKSSLCMIMCSYTHTAVAMLFGMLLLAIALKQWKLQTTLVACLSVIGAYMPLLLSHLGSRCALSRAFLLEAGGYEVRGAARDYELSLILASPLLVVAGAKGLLTKIPRYRALRLVIAVTCALFVANGLSLGLYGKGPSSMVRGLVLLVLPVTLGCSVALGGVASVLRVLFLVASMGWLIGALHWAAPRAAWTRTIDVHELDHVVVMRCAFRWVSIPDQLSR